MVDENRSDRSLGWRDRDQRGGQKRRRSNRGKNKVDDMVGV